ncbi:MAG: PASTA domain-containing protein [Deltaproteobacteria bacterium]|nr:PASTA domain-containing protein [Kofleriaceae bacterium]
MMKIATLLVALAGCAGMIKTSTSTSSGTGTGTETGTFSGNNDVTMPDLIGKSEEEAIAAVRAAGFRQDAESNQMLECVDPPEVDGKVNCQSPSAGETVKAYTLVRIHVYRPQKIAGAVVRHQLLALLGKSPDEAKRALASYGHDGEIKVEPDREFHDGCGDDRVCRLSVPESGMGIHDPITLYTNPRLTISAPPPE